MEHKEPAITLSEKNARPPYQPPRALRLGDQQVGVGNCRKGANFMPWGCVAGTSPWSGNCSPVGGLPIM